jgi:hypothetical protein
MTFSRLVVVRRLGLVGVREFPVGSAGQGDVDSGPLLLGVSLSASTVTLAAARARGDTALADSLDSEAELYGVPAQWAGPRRYAFDVLPVGTPGWPGPAAGRSPRAPSTAAARARAGGCTSCSPCCRSR